MKGRFVPFSLSLSRKRDAASVKDADNTCVKSPRERGRERDTRQRRRRRDDGDLLLPRLARDSHEKKTNAWNHEWRFVARKSAYGTLVVAGGVYRHMEHVGTDENERPLMTQAGDPFGFKGIRDSA